MANPHAVDKAAALRIEYGREDDWNGAGFESERSRERRAGAEYDGWSRAHDLCGDRLKASWRYAVEAIVDAHVSTIDPPLLLECHAECRKTVSRVRLVLP